MPFICKRFASNFLLFRFLSEFQFECAAVEEYRMTVFVFVKRDFFRSRHFKAEGGQKFYGGFVVQCRSRENSLNSAVFEKVEKC